jgi:tocopherol cyclase
MRLSRYRIWNPAAFQGGSVSRRYFEGWYFKQVDAKERRIVAVIPGISYSADGLTKHAFVQIVPSGGEMHYFDYPVEQFSADPGAPFRIRIGANVFGCDGMTLDLKDATSQVSGEVKFGPMRPWPVTTFSPGVMGWYRFVPRMETYHGVLSMDHEVSGSLVIDGERTDFNGGRGYVEKDWGRSFPSSWIWAQSNHFGRPGISLSLSVAKVPWMTGAFVGNIAGLLLDGDLHRFATYTGARLTCIEVGPNEAHLVLADKREELEVHVRGCEALILKSPVLGAMEGRDAESLGGTIDVSLRAIRGGRATVVFEGVGAQAGIEVMNDKDELGHVPCAGSTGPG